MDISRFTGLIGAAGPGTSREDLIRIVKNTEAELFSHLAGLNKSPWRKGLGLEIPRALSRFRDAVILKALEFCGGVPDGIAVAAVGGYGREELSPFSDIDILILHKEGAGVEAFAQKFLTLLWDAGYRLGNSARTTENILEDAKKDATFLTSLFEARFLAGDKALFTAITPVVRKVLASNRSRYLREKNSEIYSIISNPGYEVLLKEPDMKNGAGGLRSFHLIKWLYSAFYYTGDPADLSSFLPGNLLRRALSAYDFILYVRNLCHFTAGRKSDILTIASQIEACRYLRFKGADSDKAARLMRHYYTRSMDILLGLLYAIEELDLKFLKGMKDAKNLPGKKIGGHFFALDGKFYVRPGLDPSVKRSFEALRHFCTGGYQLTYSLVHYLGRSTGLLRDSSAIGRAEFDAFRDILSMDNSYGALNAMMLSGFLYGFIRPFRKVRHAILYNPYHLFTIDRHSIEAVKALESLYARAPKERESPRSLLLGEIARDYRGNIWLVKFALLLHDTGKSYEGDHSKNGTQIARGLMEQWPVGRQARDLILFLIDNHLLLSGMVRRANIGSREAVTDLAGKFILTPYPMEYLGALYLLTFADISSTNPSNFRAYISELLFRLYNDLASAISSSGNKGKLLAGSHRSLEKTGDPDFEDFIATMGDDYLLTNQPDEIMQDYKSIQARKGDGLAASRNEGFFVSVRAYRDYFKVKIFTPDRRGLFAFLSGVLFLNGADIVKAYIHTWSGMALDEFIITRIYGTDFYADNMSEELEIWHEDLKKKLARYGGDEMNFSRAIEDLKNRMLRVPDAFRLESAARFTQRRNQGLTLEVSGTDRPGLLYDITRLISSEGLNISSAIIDTSGWYVHDIFELEAAGDLSIEKRALLEKKLRDTIG